MIAIKYTEFRTSLMKFMDEVEKNNEILFIKQETGNGVVMMSMGEYNSIMETVHLLSSRKNSDRLFESIRQMKNGKCKTMKKLL